MELSIDELFAMQKKSEDVASEKASVQTAYEELTRMGMPSGEKGFDYKTFAKYYRK